MVQHQWRAFRKAGAAWGTAPGGHVSTQGRTTGSSGREGQTQVRCRGVASGGERKKNETETQEKKRDCTDGIGDIWVCDFVASEVLEGRAVVGSRPRPWGPGDGAKSKQGRYAREKRTGPAKLGSCPGPVKKQQKQKRNKKIARGARGRLAPRKGGFGKPGGSGYQLLRRLSGRLAKKSGTSSRKGAK